MEPFKKIREALGLEEFLKEIRERDAKLEGKLEEHAFGSEQMFQKLSDALRYNNQQLLEMRAKLDTLVDIGPANASNMTVTERKIIDLLKGKEAISANDAALEMNLSRTRASETLNNLERKGILEKTKNGKEILFQLKNRSPEQP